MASPNKVLCPAMPIWVSFNSASQVVWSSVKGACKYGASANTIKLRRSCSRCFENSASTCLTASKREIILPSSDLKSATSIEPERSTATIKSLADLICSIGAEIIIGFAKLMMTNTQEIGPQIFWKNMRCNITAPF